MTLRLEDEGKLNIEPLRDVNILFWWLSQFPFWKKLNDTWL